MSLNIHFRIFLTLTLLRLSYSDKGICNIQSELSQQQLWNIFALNSFLFYFILIVGSLSILGLLITQITWVWVPSFTLPFDIVFVILVASSIQNMTFIVQAAYYNIQQNSTTFSGFYHFCGGIGFLNLLGFITRLYQSAFFCVALAYSIQNTLKKPLFSRFKLHLICIVIIISALLIIIFTDNHNDYFSDLCVFRIINSSSLGLFFFHLLVFLFCLYNLRKFKQKIPENTFFQKHSHFRYYYVYMVIFCISQFVITLTFLISNIICSNQSSDSDSVIQILYDINIVIGFLLSFAAIYLRLGHPLLRKRWKKPSDQQEVQMIQQDGNQLLLVSSLVNSIKGSQVISFIEAIMMNFIEQSKNNSLNLTPYHFNRQYSFKIDQQITEDYIKRRVTNRESHFIKRSADGLTTLKYEVLIYTPEFYTWMIQHERINLFSSFDIRKNLCLVKDQSFTQGGQSGQFFFGTYDHKFIFKTIQSEEAAVLLSKTQQIYNYFTKTSESLLIKIFGLYKFERKDVNEDSIYLIIMKNLTMTHKSANLRVYDIKGSQLNRSTFKDKRIKLNQEQKIRKYTLKDKDFLYLEEKVHINPLQAKQLKEALTKDINFLTNLGVMDYSLLIVKRQGSPTNQKGQFRSCKQNNIIYNIGLIDYLQEWTLKKKAKRAFKTLITKEQITTNSPHAYGQRLINFIDKII